MSLIKDGLAVEQRWCFTRPERISLEQFNRMRVTKVDEKDPRSMLAPAYQRRRAMMRGKWYVVHRQFSCGVPLHFASRIVIQLKQKDVMDMSEKI